jgi:glutathione-regulated potassium-efflux system ancillary protein KefC
MATISIYLGVTFIAAMLAIGLKLPPLVGFLAAGFMLNALDVGEFPGLDVAADIGVTLLLFGIGLKLDVRSLLRREVWLTTVVHMSTTVLVALVLLAVMSMTGMALLAEAGWTGLLLVAFALSFSSTVFVVKVLSDRSETQSHYGRVAIGVLIVQDIAAVLFLTAAGGSPPSPWALLLLMVVPAAWGMRRIWDQVPHGEMQALFGIVVAFVPGYAAFELVGIKGDLGALVMGALMAGHPAANELAKSLFSIKELLLVAFFLSIGLGAMPGVETTVLAVLLLLLVPVKAAGFFLLLWRMRLSHRSSLLAALALGNYSEFALIVAAVGVDAGFIDQQWLVVLSIAVALSFVGSAVTNRTEHLSVPALIRRLPPQEPDRLHPEDRPIDLREAQAVVLGMGRIGSAAYRQLRDQYGERVVGIETDLNRVQALCAQGFDVQEGDATDAAFWERVRLADELDLVVLAMPFHGSNVEALHLLHRGGVQSTVAAIAQYDDEMQEIRALGAHAVLHLYSGAGTQLADEAVEAARERT